MKTLLLKINLFVFLFIIANLFLAGSVYGQCPSVGSYAIGSSQDWTAISGISTCNSALITTNSTFNGNVSISYSGANSELTFNVNNLTINGNLVIQSTANGNIFTIAANTTLIILGNLGDPANNNISYHLGVGSVLIVTGTIYGKNGNTIGGSGGTVSAGDLDFQGTFNCVSGDCPVINVSSCTQSGTVCAANNNKVCSTNYGGTVGPADQYLCGSILDPLAITVSGYAGQILRWESSINSGATWTGINSVSASYDPPIISLSTIYRAVVLKVSGSDFCISYSTQGTAAVRSLNTVNAGSSTPILCINSTLIDIIHTTTGATGISNNGIAGVNGLPAGVKATWLLNKITISGTPTVSGIFNYSIPLVGGCGSVSATGTITVNLLPVITLQPINQLDCEKRLVSFKAVASGSGLSYSWQRKKPTDGSFTTIPVGETNTTYPVSGEISIDNVGSAQYPNGTQFQVLISNGNCNVTSNTAILSVNEITSLTPISTAVTQCYGTNYTYVVSISYPANVVSYQWKKSVASGVWNVISNGGAYSGATTAALTITGGTPLESGEYRVYMTFTNSTTQCSVDSSTRTRQITFLPLLTTPLATVIQPNCTTPTGTIDVTVQSASDTYSFDNGVNYQPSNIKAGLTVGNYNVKIKNIMGCISTTTAAQVVSPTTTWSGSWSDGVPTISRKIIFNSVYNSTGDLSGCSCDISAGANVTVNQGHTLTIANQVNVASLGTLTFEDTASLVQLNNVSNIGNITYKRQTSIIRNSDYTYWSTPVSPQTLINVSPNTALDKFYSFNAATDSWVPESSTSTMIKGKGYIIRGPSFFPSPNPPSGIHQASFIGVPNNGDVSIPITTNNIESSYLIGNPYPSALDANSFINANSSVIDGTLYFWTHNTAITNNQYTSDDYASYNLTGGAATTSTVGTAAITSGAVPTGKIGSGQGFFVTSIAAGNIVFNNSMRVGGGAAPGNNSQFFKIAPKGLTVEGIEKNRVWLNLTNSQGAFKQTLVGYVSGATNDFDNRYDGESFDANEFIDFYSVNDDKNLVIQGRALPFVDTDEVPLGYSSTIAGDFTISIDQVDGLFTGKEIYLKDNMTNSIHNLNKSAYDYKTEIGTFSNRFTLRYTNANKTLAKEDFELAEYGVLISNKNKEVKVNSSVENIDKVLIYDMSGRQVYKNTTVNNKVLVIRNIQSEKQILIVKVELQNGQSVTQKIVY
jgi:hypothetical protein